MSGGHFNYEDQRIFQWADTIFQDKEVEEKQLAGMLRDIGKILHDYDYWKSGDSSKESFIKSWVDFCHKYKIKFLPVGVSE